MNRGRLLSVWRRVLGLSWPVMVEQTFRTAMRTTDIIVTGLFSPAAIAAIGLADLYARFPLRIGLGLGGGAIALSSQDTGAGAQANRDEAVTQAILLGLVAGIPFVAFGFLFGREAISLLGASDSVAQLGGTYLAIVFATAPARQVSLIAARSLQGTGDTRTPMYVNIVSNGLNIVGSVVLGLGLLGFQRYEIVGVGLATAFSNVFTAVVLCAIMWVGGTSAGFALPSNPIIARQLVVVSAPRVVEGFADTLAEFPFNALLLGFGTEVNAAFQVGRRLYQQVTGPLSRGYSVAASVVVGQALGEGDPEQAKENGVATALLGLVTVGGIGLALVVGAPLFVRVFTRDPATVGYAVDFARTYGLAAPALVTFVVFSGSLQGGSETRTPFVARVAGLLVFFLGFSYVVGVTLGYGVLGAYGGIIGYYGLAAVLVTVGFVRGDWARRAAKMMADRGSAAD
ncbi:MATE family efflux transporter [Haloarchaeobius sp. HME9146]|uniref:MATE family efflux transporter n=1 Tax=Haloarchaeobius sp. HME9146 TaxID=2978732 RepID=UPI0021C1E1CF|nr:MATE family efflux transporter [Haloarchaeobius sp. HME9146]MCT9094555.1 MATE family efflux transporter [Haloarchaeobius sp. HME9146]